MSFVEGYPPFVAQESVRLGIAATNVTLSSSAVHEIATDAGCARFSIRENHL